ncbi:MAG: N-6 DNA methylase [Candidatus Poseidoniales archaeon]
MGMKYGVVYTPPHLAEFTTQLMANYISVEKPTILDPACGEGALLEAAKASIPNAERFVGIDIDEDVNSNINSSIEFHFNDAILPKSGIKSAEFWKAKIGPVHASPVNPPWSSEKMHQLDELIAAGFELPEGQFDSYVLFIELVYHLLDENGVAAFILPESFFEEQNRAVRKFLLENTEIKVVADLGEGLFDDVYRGCVVVVFKKKIPSNNHQTTCFKLGNQEKKNIQANKSSLMDEYSKSCHEVFQTRWTRDETFEISVELRVYEQELFDKITNDCINWDDHFAYSRGVELSKSGRVVECSKCNHLQGFTQEQEKKGLKACSDCKETVLISEQFIRTVIIDSWRHGTTPIIVGEGLHRYRISNERFIENGHQSINYKLPETFQTEKLLIRKTGLGINASLDSAHRQIIQVIHSIRQKEKTEMPIPLSYLLALVNSRVVYYIALKRWGETEWRSHPYMTKAKIFSLSIKPYIGDEKDLKICSLAQQLNSKYTRETDIELEKLVMEKYNLTLEQKHTVIQAINKTQDLGAINEMKAEVCEFV